jgi:hypothetical protein
LLTSGSAAKAGLNVIVYIAPYGLVEIFRWMFLRRQECSFNGTVKSSRRHPSYPINQAVHALLKILFYHNLKTYLMGK